MILFGQHCGMILDRLMHAFVAFHLTDRTEYPFNEKKKKNQMMMCNAENKCLGRAEKHSTLNHSSEISRQKVSSNATSVQTLNAK